MPDLINFVAADWRSGKDQIYFFFKYPNTYSRYDVGQDRVIEHEEINSKAWGDFAPHAKNLCFAFHTDRIVGERGLTWDADVLWLFYYDKTTPMVCEYDQDAKRPKSFKRVEHSIWSMLLPYFDNIIAGTCWQRPFKGSGKYIFKFILDDGNFIHLDWQYKTPVIGTIDDSTWPGLAAYKDDIITAVQIDSDFTDNYLYIFLSGSRYLKYNIDENRLQVGARDVGANWPGLVRN